MVQHVIATLDHLATGAPQAPVAVNTAPRAGTATIGEMDCLDDREEQIAGDVFLLFPLGQLDYVGDCIIYDRRRRSAFRHDLCAPVFDGQLRRRWRGGEEGSGFER